MTKMKSFGDCDPNLQNCLKKVDEAVNAFVDQQRINVEDQTMSICTMTMGATQSSSFTVVVTIWW